MRRNTDSAERSRLKNNDTSFHLDHEEPQSYYAKHMLQQQSLHHEQNYLKNKFNSTKNDNQSYGFFQGISNWIDNPEIVLQKNTPNTNKISLRTDKKSTKKFLSSNKISEKKYNHIPSDEDIQKWSRSRTLNGKQTEEMKQALAKINHGYENKTIYLNKIKEGEEVKNNNPMNKCMNKNSDNRNAQDLRMKKTIQNIKNFDKRSFAIKKIKSDLLKCSYLRKSTDNCRKNNIYSMSSNVQVEEGLKEFFKIEKQHENSFYEQAANMKKYVYNQSTDKQHSFKSTVSPFILKTKFRRLQNNKCMHLERKYQKIQTEAPIKQQQFRLNLSLINEFNMLSYYLKRQKN